MNPGDAKQPGRSTIVEEVQTEAPLTVDDEDQIFEIMARQKVASAATLRGHNLDLQIPKQLVRGCGFHRDASHPGA
jgi:hypothetical protein